MVSSTRAKRICHYLPAGASGLRFFYLNEASLQGQFPDETEFLALLEAILAARSKSPIFRKMGITPCIRERSVSYGRNFREVVQGRGAPHLKKAVLAWVTRDGPFVHDDRLCEDDDLFHCLGLDVTDGGLGEAGRRVKSGEPAAAMSFPGGPKDFAFSPLWVVHGLEEEPIATYEVRNFWEVEKALDAAFALDEPANTWPAAIEAARARFPKLSLPDSIWRNKRLANQPFDPIIRDRSLELLGHLNEYMLDRNRDGSEGPRSREIVGTCFRGDGALFSPESTTNQNVFRDEMTFEDPDGGSPVFAHWHGKVRHRHFRMHFEWPVPGDAEKIKVLYIGPKITKS